MVVLVMTRLLILVAVLGSAVSGCTGSSSHPQTTTTSSAQAKTLSGSGDHEITMAVGESLKVTLAGNHSLACWWAANAQIGDPTVIQQTNHEYVASNTTGGPGTEDWTFKALNAGTTTITNTETTANNSYLQANPDTQPCDTFMAKVTVQ